MLKAVDDAVGLRESLRDAPDVPTALVTRGTRRTTPHQMRSLAHGFRRSLVDEAVGCIAAGNPVIEVSSRGVDADVIYLHRQI